MSDQRSVVVQSSSGPLVSIIMPVHNAAAYLTPALISVLEQTYRPLEISIYDDKSFDSSVEIIESFLKRFERSNIAVSYRKSTMENALGPGFARNEAILHSNGEYLCHLDADDVMYPNRVLYQLQLAKEKGNDCLVGCNFDRDGSTPYYTNWLNSMNDEDLVIQQYRECTIICPSWFYHKDVYNKIARLRSGCGKRAFVESTENSMIVRIPEDTYFFMDHLQTEGTLAKHDSILLTYRYTANSWAQGTSNRDLQWVRIKYLEDNVISKWGSFMIWGYGKDAKKIFTMMSPETQDKVTAFCDVDKKKVGRLHYCSNLKKHIKVLDTAAITSPFIVLCSSKRTNGELESNISLLGFYPVVNYIQFC